MMGRATLAIAAFFLVLGAPAWAHRIDEYLQATLLSVEATRVEGSMRLIPGVLVASSVIAEVDSNGDGVLSEEEQRAYARRVLSDLSLAIDGEIVPPQLLSWTFPQPAEMRAGLGEIHIEYQADLPQRGPNRRLILSNHHQNRTSVYLVNVKVPEDSAIHIQAQRRNEQQSVYELDYMQTAAPIALTRGWWTDVRAGWSSVEFSSLFQLGMRHIREGTDHLLFLLTLLLPASLSVSGSRWGGPVTARESLLRIVGIVTAFTIGHSVTLMLGALGVFQLPSRPIEVMIAVSIFISALHALRPIVPGKEAWLASFFGLIHGLAFASTLNQLGLEPWQRVTGILAFNLGIETMQLLVVAAILPSLLLLSVTPAYTLFRTGGAVFAAGASVGWMVERIFDVGTPVDAIVNAFASQALWIAVTLFVLSLIWIAVRPHPSPEAT